MSLIIITVGDTTTHGGRVISGSPTHTLRGRQIARLGDLVDCVAHYPDGRPHGVNKIIECSAAVTVGGIPVVLEGHKCECGCALIGSQPGTVG
jgi:uncharacterized Zn-binding protein involved in type VI secretion